MNSSSASPSTTMIDPSQAYIQGIWHYRKEDFKSATDCLQSAIRAYDPSNESHFTRNGLIHAKYLLADIYDKQGNSAASIQLYKDAYADAGSESCQASDLIKSVLRKKLPRTYASVLNTNADVKHSEPTYLVTPSQRHIYATWFQLDGNLKQAILYYDLSHDISKLAGDNNIFSAYLLLDICYCLAKLYQGTNDFLAEGYASLALEVIPKIDPSLQTIVNEAVNQLLLLTRQTKVIAMALYEEGQHYESSQEFDRALLSYKHALALNFPFYAKSREDAANCYLRISFFHFDKAEKIEKQLTACDAKEAEGLRQQYHVQLEKVLKYSSLLLQHFSKKEVPDYVLNATAQNRWSMRRLGIFPVARTKIESLSNVDELAVASSSPSASTPKAGK